MDDRIKSIALLENRENIYRFLSRLYILEVDEDLLILMKNMEFPTECQETELNEGYRILEEYIKNTGTESLEELAADYAKAFLAAGVAQGLAAFPYESVYTDKRRLMMQDARNQVAGLYQSKNLKASDDMFRIAEDHIGLEMGYMAHLCEKSREAAKKEDRDKFGVYLKEQKSFLDTHLRNWVSGFCYDLGNYAETGFYQGVAKITKGFLELEHEMMETGDKLWDIG